MIELLRYNHRLLRIFIHLSVGILLSTIIRNFIKQEDFLAISCWWHGRVLEILNIHIDIEGEPSESAGLMVSNHISWLDISVIGSCYPVFFLSKEEVRKWPLVGQLVKAAGTLFIKRGGNNSRAIGDQIRNRISSGYHVLFFPEGTTGNGVSIKRFYPRLFGAAIEASCPIYPIAIRYDHDQHSDLVPFTDGQSFINNFLNVISLSNIKVSIKYGSSIDTVNKKRKQVAQEAQRCIEQLLGLQEIEYFNTDISSQSNHQSHNQPDQILATSE